MSRSYRKSKIFGIAKPKAGSMSDYRQYRAGKERAKVRSAIANFMNGDEYSTEDLSWEQEPWNEWDCPRDGKKYWPGATSKDFRK